MSKYWSNLVKNIVPYVPGEQPQDKQYIKINTNENPYPPSPKAIEAMKAAIGENIRLYPDPECKRLRDAIAHCFNLSREHVFVGNGSDEVLAFAFMAFFNPGLPILFADITYSFYPVYSSLFNIEYKLIELDDNFDLPVDRLLSGNGGIIIANPNAPTGKYIGLDCIEKILISSNNSVVVVDEAYIDFGGESAAGLVNKYTNLLIIRTMSKSHSLAGLRVGYALGHEDLIQGLDRIKNSINSYTLDRVALAGAEEALRDAEYFDTTRRKIIATRDRVTEKLRDMGFKVIDSQTNFVFTSHDKISGGELFKQLKDMGILVRYFNKPRIDNYLRVSIGTDYEMDCFLDAVGKIIESKV